MKPIFPIACALIVNEQGEIFLQQRNEPGTDSHGKWNFPGGGLEFGEDPEQTLLREVKEETNLEVKIKRLLPKVFSHVWPDAQILLICYECHLASPSEFSNYKPQDIEVLQGRFFKRHEIDDLDLLPKNHEIIALL